MARHDQRPSKKDMQCPACKRNECETCVNILLGKDDICTCTKKFHTDGEPNRAQILDPDTGVVHAPGLTVDPDGTVQRTDTTGASAIAGRSE